MLKLSAGAVKQPDWLKAMSPEEQQKYFEENPNSRYHPDNKYKDLPKTENDKAQKKVFEEKGKPLSKENSEDIPQALKDAVTKLAKDCLCEHNESIYGGYDTGTRRLTDEERLDGFLDYYDPADDADLSRVIDTLDDSFGSPVAREIASEYLADRNDYADEPSHKVTYKGVIEDLVNSGKIKNPTADDIKTAQKLSRQIQKLKPLVNQKIREYWPTAVKIRESLGKKNSWGEPPHLFGEMKSWDGPEYDQAKEIFREALDQKDPVSYYKQKAVPIVKNFSVKKKQREEQKEIEEKQKHQEEIKKALDGARSSSWDELLNDALSQAIDDTVMYHDGIRYEGFASGDDFMISCYSAPSILRKVLSEKGLGSDSLSEKAIDALMSAADGGFVAEEGRRPYDSYDKEYLVDNFDLTSKDASAVMKFMDSFNNLMDKDVLPVLKEKQAIVDKYIEDHSEDDDYSFDDLDLWEATSPKYEELMKTQSSNIKSKIGNSSKTEESTKSQTQNDGANNDQTTKNAPDWMKKMSEKSITNYFDKHPNSVYRKKTTSMKRKASLWLKPVK